MPDVGDQIDLHADLGEGVTDDGGVTGSPGPGGVQVPPNGQPVADP